MSSSVLDASAVLALLNGEPGADLVAETIESGAARQVFFLGLGI